MKIQLISDTHNCLNRFMPHPCADVIVHAGDFVRLGSDDCDRHIDEFVTRCEQAGKPHVLVLGNHDYYGREIGLDYPKELESRGINVLYRGKEFVFGGTTFVGDTLWSDFDLYGELSLADLGLIYRGILDFSSILAEGGLDFEHLIHEHRQALDFLENYRHRHDVFVITHFPPCVAMTQDNHKDSPFNPYFINNLDMTGFRHWACGHVHYTDRRVQDGCQLYINASGYQSSDGRVECPDFDPNFLIEC